MKIDDWMTGYLKDRYSKSVLISTANRVKSISRRVTDIDQDLSEIKTMLQQMGGKSPALKVSSIGSPEELFKILSISPAPDNSHCIVKLKCGFSFRMNQQALDRWLLCSQLQPLNDICYPSPESLSIDNVTKIMSSLYYVDDSKLREFIDSNPAIESLIVD